MGERWSWSWILFPARPSANPNQGVQGRGARHPAGPSPCLPRLRQQLALRRKLSERSGAWPPWPPWPPLVETFFKKMKGGVEWGDNQPTNLASRDFLLEVGPRGWPWWPWWPPWPKVTLGAVARHPGAGVGYLGRLVGSSMTGGRRPRRLATTPPRRAHRCPRPRPPPHSPSPRWQQEHERAAQHLDSGSGSGLGLRA